jgi:hypothetical protein
MEKCKFCGADTEVRLDGVPICEQCAVDRENARLKYEQRVNPATGKLDVGSAVNGAGKTKEPKGE